MSSEDLKPLEEWRALLLFAVVLLFSLVVDPNKESPIVSSVFSTPTHFQSVLVVLSRFRPVTRRRRSRMG